MKQLRRLLIGCLLCASLAKAAPPIVAAPRILQNWTTTNTIVPPPDDTYVLGTVGGLPALVHLGTNTTIINNLVTNNTFLTSIATNNTFVVTLATNNTFILSVITNNQFNNFFNTNIFTNITVSQTFTGNKIQVNNLVITNAVATQTNKWSGPTNTLDLNVYSQSFTSPSAMSVTGFNLPTNAPEGQALLQVSNTSATNWVATIDSHVVVTANGVIGGTCTVTNGTTGYFWFHYTPANNGARTNLVFSQL